jgi:hypothetical protein
MSDLALGQFLELTNQEERIVEERLGVSTQRAVHLLNAAWDWATEHTESAEDFEARFPEFASSYRLPPTMAKLAVDYVIQSAAANTMSDADMRGFELMVSKKPEAEWTEDDTQAWEAFMASCKTAAMEASPSMRLYVTKIKDRGIPTTNGEIKEAAGLAYLREWARAQIN